ASSTIATCSTTTRASKRIRTPSSPTPSTSCRPTSSRRPTPRAPTCESASRRPRKAAMPAAPAPVLVYDRIDANRRAAGLWLAAFAALLLPIAYTAAQYFAMALALASRSGVSTPLSATHREIFAGWMALAALLSAVALAYVGYACATFVLLRHVGARPASRDLTPELFGLVESLSIGAGLPTPRLYIIESLTPNAFTIGAEPGSASLVVTRGLLQLLDRRELAAVIAHELSHIGNRDTDLSLALSALVATMRMPQTAV